MRKIADHFTDFLIVSGLILLGSGLFLWFGPGPALTADGFILLSLGIYGEVKR